jgi:anti-sigma-K factor RskA
MTRELSRAELDELLGAFALDALDGDEREQVEQYLGRSPAARAVLAEYRETASFLAHSGTEAPAGLWQRIEQRLAEEPAPSEAEPLVSARTRRAGPGAPLTRWVAVAVAAAAVVLMVGALAVKVVQQDDRISDLARETDRGGVLAAAEAASRDPNAAKIRLSSPDGALAARVVYLPDGEGFLVPRNLRRLPSELTYQLWAQVGDPQSPRSISAGVLGSDPDATAFRVSGSVVGFAITEELAPGVVSSVNPAVAQGPVD